MQAHNNLGLVYQQQGKLDDAIAECKTALSLKPNFVYAHYNLARAIAPNVKLTGNDYPISSRFSSNVTKWDFGYI